METWDWTGWRPAGTWGLLARREETPGVKLALNTSSQHSNNENISINGNAIQGIIWFQWEINVNVENNTSLSEWWNNLIPDWISRLLRTAIIRLALWNKINFSGQTFNWNFNLVCCGRCDIQLVIIIYTSIIIIYRCI